MRALLFVILAACGGSPEEDETDPGPDTTTEGDETAPAEEIPEDARVLGAGATFGDLVASARRLDDRREADSDAGCILRGTGPFRLEADLSVAVRPLPDAPADLDARLARATGPVRVLTRWGQLGGSARDVALVALTSTMPLRATEGFALFITDEGIYVRGVGEGEAMPPGPLPLADAMARVGEQIERAALPLFVTAEAGIPLGRVRELLAAIPTALSGLVSLTVPLAPETRLPDPTPPAGDSRLLCPDGLAEPPAGTAVGRLDARQIVSSLTPLREGARQCFDNATGTAALGGRISLHLRIGTDGEVVDACFTEDGVGDPTFRACVLEAARATRFPAPDPRGVVDAAIPLAFTPDTSMRQAPLCD